MSWAPMIKSIEKINNLAQVVDNQLDINKKWWTPNGKYKL
jgi:hypothetical protein